MKESMFCHNKLHKQNKTATEFTFFRLKLIPCFWNLSEVVMVMYKTQNNEINIGYNK